MQWNKGRRSTNVEGQRRIHPAGIIIGGGVGILILSLMARFLGGDRGQLADLAQNNPQTVPQPAGPPAGATDDQLRDFVSAIVGSTEDVWRELFSKMNKAYEEPHLVLFKGQVQSACGPANSAIGPFYCPRDQKVFIDLSFFQEMKDRYDTPGDFARAYVIAHEIGHHVQKLLGIGEKLNSSQRPLSKEDAEQLLVRLELHADFLAGVWAHQAQKTRQILEPGDVEAALHALTVLGDDRLQGEKPVDNGIDSATRCWHGRHGNARQRVRWFTSGLKTGDLSQGDALISEEL
jgi:uncharacterized protein